jgi:hypothetical protein
MDPLAKKMEWGIWIDGGGMDIGDFGFLILLPGNSISGFSRRVCGPDDGLFVHRAGWSVRRLHLG